jgi:hypothetical protein
MAAADNRVAGAFSGKVGTGFPSENATTQKKSGQYLPLAPIKDAKP